MLLTASCFPLCPAVTSTIERRAMCGKSSIGKTNRRFKQNKSGRRARSSRLPGSPFGECPASLTEGGQPVVCWPAYETPENEKRFHVEQRNSVKSASPAQPEGANLNPHVASFQLKSR